MLFNLWRPCNTVGHSPTSSHFPAYHQCLNHKINDVGQQYLAFHSMDLPDWFPLNPFMLYSETIDVKEQWVLMAATVEGITNL